MEFCDDLLEQAANLLDGWNGRPANQAGLRRSVSASYYALFHLLIDEAVSNWSIGRQRNGLARTFEHRGMKKVCEAYVSNFYASGQPPDGINLKNVAQAFIELQDKRHTADYDHSQIWTPTSAEALVLQAIEAVDRWRSIRHEEKSQDFLYAMLFPKPRGLELK